MFLIGFSFLDVACKAQTQHVEALTTRLIRNRRKEKQPGAGSLASWESKASGWVDEQRSAFESMGPSCRIKFFVPRLCFKIAIVWVVLDVFSSRGIFQVITLAVSEKNQKISSTKDSQRSNDLGMAPTS